MATAITVDNVNQTLNRTVVSGTITLTANYGGAGGHGDTLSFLNQDSIKSQTPPVHVEIFEVPPAGTSATGFVYNFSPGTDLGNGLLQVFGTGSTAAAKTPLTEYTQGDAYSAGLLAAVIKYEAVFSRL